MPGARLTVEDREEVMMGLAQGHSFAHIGRALRRPTSTVSREVHRRGGLKSYRAVAAHRAAVHRRSRPKPRKLTTHPRLARQVSQMLGRKWSPQQIAVHLRQASDDPSQSVSHETIYQCLYLQGRVVLRKELRQALRTGRAKRRPQGRANTSSLKDMVLISERPAEVEDRAVPGHWEGDLIVGKDNHSQVGTLVERASRFVMLVALPDGKSAHLVQRALSKKMGRLPAVLQRSLTWDQGSEMAEHQRFTMKTGMPVYFCDPHSPWQRGSNENTNGLLRQYMPKGTDLSKITQRKLNRIALELNTRPRQTLGWMTPAQKYAQIVAMAP